MIDDFDVSLFQIFHGICVPISIQIGKDMIKLVQKQNGAVFYASQCSVVVVIIIGT